MKRYVVTTAVPGAPVNQPFLTSLQNYCRTKKAKLLILPAQKLCKEDTLDENLPKDAIVMRPYRFNDNLRISSIPTHPELADPASGIDRLAGSFIVASPKQRLKSVAKTGHVPRVIMSPGAVTGPYYNGSRRGIMAATDHVDGAIIVEVVNRSEYHFRQIQADAAGRFIDLGVQYDAATAREAAVAALIPGDWHVGATDPKVRAVVLELIQKFSPRYLVLHDFLDGLSVNHHIADKRVTRAKLSEHHCLSTELEACAKELMFLEKTKAKQILIVRSNHDEFLDQWLEEGKYIDDPHNFRIGHILALAKLAGYNPLESACAEFGGLDKTVFLGIDDDIKITPEKIHISAHGHKGPNGARASSGAHEKVLGNAVVGHHHSPEILRGLYVVGTSTYLKLSYNTGPSSWLQTLCVVYESGARQLINVIEGRYHG